MNQMQVRIVMPIYYCQGKMFYRTRLLSLVVLATIAACANPGRHAQSLAVRGGLRPVLLQGTDFQHRAFAALRGAGLLVLFVEGDGSPWIQGGSRVAVDPTPRVPLA